MKILLAADGSKFTKKALAYLVVHENLSGPGNEILVLHVQAPVPARVKTMLGVGAVAAYHREEADKVLEPVEKFLQRHGVKWKCKWKVGSIHEEILRVAKDEKSELIVMGTHGHGLLGRAVMGSVAQRVVAHCEVPVLLVK